MPKIDLVKEDGMSFSYTKTFEGKDARRDAGLLVEHATCFIRLGVNPPVDACVEDECADENCVITIRTSDRHDLLLLMNVLEPDVMNPGFQGFKEGGRLRLGYTKSFLDMRETMPRAVYETFLREWMSILEEEINTDLSMTRDGDDITLRVANYGALIGVKAVTESQELIDDILRKMPQQVSGLTAPSVLDHI